MPLPVLGRLRLHEWVFVLVLLTMVWVETVVLAITFLLPANVIDWCTEATQAAFRWGSKEDQPPKNSTSAPYHRLATLQAADSVAEMCAVYGFTATTHLVRTRDDYLLTLHRIQRLDPRQRTPPNGEIVYLHHGLLMSLEIWVSMLEEHQNLPFVLADLGYDVWLGNNRGNKYSNKHLHHDINLAAFWDFSLDEFALYDIPGSVEYVLATARHEWEAATHTATRLSSTTSLKVLEDRVSTFAPGRPASQVTYIGFSQGTAQAFAAVSVSPTLSRHVKRLVAILPATTPKGLSNKLVDTLVKALPKIVYLMLGTKILMPSVQFWRNTMYPPLYVKAVDLGNRFLFGWRLANMRTAQKLALYRHLYLPTSVKCVVHWFQIILRKTFQMFDDQEGFTAMFRPVEYPLAGIRVPVDLIYGDADLLVDIDVMKRQLGNGPNISVYRVPGYEHLENLWGVGVEETIFPHIVLLLEEDRGMAPVTRRVVSGLVSGLLPGRAAAVHRLELTLPATSVITSVLKESAEGVME